MARMIPSAIDVDYAPPGEIDLFNMFRDHTPDSWIVLHSVDLPRHVRQFEGELDFLVLAPGLAVVAIEVKSHQRVSRDARGMWRLGQDEPTSRGPFKQASESMYSTRNKFRNELGLSGVPFVAVVAFPRCRFDMPASEWEPWEVFDESDLASKGLGNLIERAGLKHREKLASTETTAWFSERANEPTTEQCEQMVRIIRPTFERSRSPKARRAEIEGEIRRYTEEQFAALDALEANPRVVFTGAAGTGKTFVALEAARRGVSRGERVLLCCYNSLLGKWMRREAAPLEPMAEIGTLHSLMLKIAGTAASDSPTPSYWAEDLPALAVEKLLDGHPLASSFDLVVIDEAQDICSPAYLDVVDLLLRDGLSGGKLFAFGDFEYQSIYTDQDARDILASRSKAAAYTLSMNCRNRPRIGVLAATSFGKGPYRDFKRPDDGVDVILQTYSESEDQVAKLAHLIDTMRRDNYQLEDIVILSPRNEGAAHHALTAPHSGWLCAADRPSTARIRTSTIHAYKGLEAAAVIITDIAELSSTQARQLLYIGATRATDRLAVLVDHGIKPELTELIIGGTS